MSHQVFIALGSNLGDRANNLRAALMLIQPEVVPVDCSPVYETPPWGYESQPSFLNQVIRAETDLEPQDLLTHLKNVEAELGRKETFRFGPRIIDLDILFFDQIIVYTPPLIIPHPALPERAFVLVPLADLAPDYLHPITRLTVRQMLENLDTSGLIEVSPSGCEQLE